MPLDLIFFSMNMYFIMKTRDFFVKIKYSLNKMGYLHLSPTEIQKSDVDIKWVKQHGLEVVEVQFLRASDHAVSWCWKSC